MTCLGQANLDRLTANAEKRDRMDEVLGTKQVYLMPERFRYLDPKDDYYRDEEDDGS